MTLQQWIIVFGCIQLVLCQVWWGMHTCWKQVWQAMHRADPHAALPDTCTPSHSSWCLHQPPPDSPPHLHRLNKHGLLPQPHVLPQFPSIHDLRILNLASTICTVGFAATATALSIYSGAPVWLDRYGCHEHWSDKPG